jgi:hypothetical protein
VRFQECVTAKKAIIVKEVSLDFWRKRFNSLKRLRALVSKRRDDC